MTQPPEVRPHDHAPAADLAALEEHIRSRLGGRLRDFRLVVTDAGLILRGYSHTNYVKQLTQQAVLDAVTTPIVANKIEVR